MMRTGWWKSFVVLTDAGPGRSHWQGQQGRCRASTSRALAQVPANAPLVVYLHGLEGSGDRLLVYLKNALPANFSAAAEAAIKKFREDGVEGRKFRGM